MPSFLGTSNIILYRVINDLCGRPTMMMLYIDNYDLQMQHILFSAYAYYNFPIKCCLMK